MPKYSVFKKCKSSNNRIKCVKDLYNDISNRKKIINGNIIYFEKITLKHDCNTIIYKIINYYSVNYSFKT